MNNHAIAKVNLQNCKIMTNRVTSWSIP